MVDINHVAPFAASGEGHAHLKNGFAAQPWEKMQPGRMESHILNPFSPKENPYQNEDPMSWGYNMITNAPCTKVLTANINSTDYESYVDIGTINDARGQHIYQSNQAARLMPANKDYHSFHDPETTIQNKTGGIAEGEPHIDDMDQDKIERAWVCGAIGLFILSLYLMVK